MSNQQLQIQSDNIVSAIIVNGDLSKLSPNDKVVYYKQYCERLGLDPFTQPFKILKLQGKETLYCDRTGTQQLNKLHKVSHKISARETFSDCYVVTACAYTPDNRQTESIGAVNISGLKGEALCNAMMKAETKAKRRATLDLLGLGVLDESELETIPNAQTQAVLVSEDDGTNAPGIGKRKEGKQAMPETTAYNHQQLAKDGKPLISNEQYKKLLERVQSGDLEAYNKAIETFSFEATQRSTLDQAYETSKAIDANIDYDTWQDAINECKDGTTLKKFYQKNKTPIDADPKIFQMVSIRQQSFSNQKEAV